MEIPTGYADAHEVAQRIEVAFATNLTPRATSHNDLLNAILLRDGDHVWIVDYEYAGVGDPFFDLGALGQQRAPGRRAGDAAAAVLGEVTPGRALG